MADQGRFDEWPRIDAASAKLPTVRWNKIDQEKRQEVYNSHHETMMRCLSMKQKRNLDGRRFRSRRVRTLLMRPSFVAGTASAVVFICLSPLQVNTASASPALSASAAYSNSVSDVPYALPVTNLPSTTQSPSVAADAPYTPAVLNLIAQLEPSSPPTEAELANAVSMFAGGSNSTCPGTGPVGSPTLAASATVPSIMSMCWADAQGVNLTSGANAANTRAGGG